MTADAAIQPDPLVRTALRLLPVPAHNPGFWAELDALLALEPTPQNVEPALAAGPRVAAGSPADVPRRTADRLVADAVMVVDIPVEVDEVVAPSVRDDPMRRLVPASLRRRSNVVLLAIAVGAVVLVMACVALLLRQPTGAGAASEGSGPSPTPAVLDTA